jgi:hypothetical protein
MFDLLLLFTLGCVTFVSNFESLNYWYSKRKEVGYWWGELSHRVKWYIAICVQNSQAHWIDVFYVDV